MAVTLTGVQETIAEHRILADRARDLRPLLRVFADEVEAMIARAFRDRRSPGGERWAPTARESERSGELERSVGVDVRGGELTIRVGAEHASFVLFGTARSPGRNALPVEWVGGELRWMSRGEAGAWMDSMVQRLEAYLSDTEAA